MKKEYKRSVEAGIEYPGTERSRVVNEIAKKYKSLSKTDKQVYTSYSLIDDILIDVEIWYPCKDCHCRPSGKHAVAFVLFITLVLRNFVHGI
jgi:hypothetical protein